MNRLRSRNPTRLTQLPFQGSSGYFSHSSGTSSSFKSSADTFSPNKAFSGSSRSIGCSLSPGKMYSPTSSNTACSLTKNMLRFDLGGSDMSWSQNQSAPSSPLKSGPISDQTLYKYYHPFCFPEIPMDSSVLNDCGKSRAIKSSTQQPSRAKALSFRDSTSIGNVLSPLKPCNKIKETKSQPIDSMTFSLGPDSPEILEITVEEYQEFRPSLSSTPDKKPIIYHASVKRKLEISTKENQPNEKKHRKIAHAKRKNTSIRKSYCEFCKDNGEPELIYNHHTLKDTKGRCLCPVLRQIECRICKADGDDAHTADNCPKKGQPGVGYVRRFLSFLHI